MRKLGGCVSKQYAVILVVNGRVIQVDKPVVVVVAKCRRSVRFLPGDDLASLFLEFEPVSRLDVAIDLTSILVGGRVTKVANKKIAA